jgi:hypothetical protein
MRTGFLLNDTKTFEILCLLRTRLTHFLPITVENLPFKGQGHWNMEPLSSVTGMC